MGDISDGMMVSAVLRTVLGSKRTDLRPVGSVLERTLGRIHTNASAECSALTRRRFLIQLTLKKKKIQIQTMTKAIHFK